MLYELIIFIIIKTTTYCYNNFNNKQIFYNTNQYYVNKQIQIQIIFIYKLYRVLNPTKFYSILLLLLTTWILSHS